MPSNHSQTQMATWRVTDQDAADLLLGRDAPDWFDLEAAPQAERIKRNALRSVYRTSIRDRVFYVKVYRKSRFSEWFKRTFQGDPAYREVRASEYAARNSVATARFIGWGQSHDASTSGYSVSLSPAIEHAGTFADVFERCATNGEASNRTARNSLLDACALLQANAHDGAFLHPDNHAKNILVRAGEDSPECVFVDVYGARCGTTVSLKDAAKNLAPLGHWLLRNGARREAAAALKRYCHYRNLFVTTAARKRWTRLVLRQIQIHAHRLYRKRDRRIGGSNAYFERIALTGGWRAYATIRFRRMAQTVHRDNAPQNNTAAIRRSLNERIRDDFALAKGPLLVDRSDTERFFPGRPTDRVLWRFDSPAWRRYRSSLMAMNRDLPCVVGWTYLEQRDGASVLQAGWIRCDPPNCVPLASWLNHHDDAADRRLVLERVGTLLANTLDRGLVPQNLGQLPIVVCDLNDSHRVMWSGIEAARVGGSASEHVRQYVLKQAANTTQWIPRRIAARILRSYCKAGRAGSWKITWRSLSATTGAMTKPSITRH